MKIKSHSLDVSQQPRFRRRLFGIRSNDVWAVLDDREEELATLRQRADSDRSQATMLRQHVTELEAKIENAEHELAMLKGHELIHQSDGDESAAKFCGCPPSDALLEDMTRVVQVTEESTQRILRHAHDTLMKEIEAAEALRGQARSEIAEAAAWRRHWAPILRAFQTTVTETGAAIEEIPERVRDALAPLTAAAAALDEDLRQFAAFEVTISMDSGHPGDGAMQQMDQDAGAESSELAETAHDDPIVVDEAEEPKQEGDTVVVAGEAEPDPASASMT